ncbi:MAG: helicase-related protein, partial [Pyrinomonadaceae bacterium]
RGKLPLALQVLRAEYKRGDRWLVYCDDSGQLDAVARILRGAEFPVYEYHSAMEGSRVATMTAFSTHGGILVAIKCLDEGVDIPSVNRALILASSANPREFIQRRGRVLRVAPDKLSAAIHDALVLPESSGAQGEEGVRSFVRSDLARALEFARYARNTAVSTELRLWSAELGLVTGDLTSGSYEQEEPNA